MYYCSEKCSQILLVISSVFTIFLGAATVWVAYWLDNRNEWHTYNLYSDQEENDDGILQPSQQIMYIIILIVGGLTIVISIMGFITAKCSNCCTISSFSFLSLIMFSILGVIGTYFILLALSTRDSVDQFCSTNETLGDTPLDRRFSDLIINMNDTQNLISNYMCTNRCPCSEVEYEQWGDYSNEFQNNDDYQFDGSYSNFYDCYQDLVKDGVIVEAPEKEIEIIRELEEKYYCQGLCQAQRFYFFKHINEGPPENNCVNGLKRQFELVLGLPALIILAAGIFVFLSFNVQYGLWKKKYKSRENRPDRYRVR